KLGALSADTWTMGAIWLRNTTLNFIILVAGFIALLTVPRALALLYAPEIGPFDLTAPAQPLALGLLVLLGTAAVGVGLNLRAVTEDKPEARAAQRSAITMLVTLPVVLSALLLSQWLHDTPELFTAPPLHLHLLSVAPWFLVLFMVIQVVSDFPRRYNRTHANSRWRVPGLWAAMLLIPAASAAAAASL